MTVKQKQRRTSPAGMRKKLTHEGTIESALVDETTGRSALSLVDEPGRHSTMMVTVSGAARAGPDSESTPTGQGPLNRCVTRNQAAPGPRTSQRLNRLRALRLLNRFRQLRSIDLAVGLFPEREFKAALSAVQRLTKALVAQKMLLRYRSLSGQTYYALGEAGARWLRQNGDELDGDATASASRVSERTNPEHDLWSAFATMSSEARGLWAMSEKELVPHLVGSDLRSREQVLVVADERGRPKGLMPDAVAHDGRNLVWFELDRSERGSTRLADLICLVRSCGRTVNLGSAHTSGELRIRHVVVLCKTDRIFRRHLAYVTGSSPNSGVPRLRTLGGQSALRQVAPGVFDVLADIERRLEDGRVALQREVVGRLHFQLLPAWLPGFSYRPGALQDGWFSDGYLPFRNLPKGWPGVHETGVAPL